MYVWVQLKTITITRFKLYLFFFLKKNFYTYFLEDVQIIHSINLYIF